jgi:hypothetical protein
MWDLFLMMLFLVVITIIYTVILFVLPWIVFVLQMISSFLFVASAPFLVLAIIVLVQVETVGVCQIIAVVMAFIDVIAFIYSVMLQMLILALFLVPPLMSALFVFLNVFGATWMMLSSFFGTWGFVLFVVLPTITVTSIVAGVTGTMLAALVAIYMFLSIAMYRCGQVERLHEFFIMVETMGMYSYKIILFIGAPMVTFYRFLVAVAFTSGITKKLIITIVFKTTKDAVFAPIRRVTDKQWPRLKNNVAMKTVLYWDALEAGEIVWQTERVLFTYMHQIWVALWTSPFWLVIAVQRSYKGYLMRNSPSLTGGYMEQEIRNLEDADDDSDAVLKATAVRRDMKSILKRNFDVKLRKRKKRPVGTDALKDSERVRAIAYWFEKAFEWRGFEWLLGFNAFWEDPPNTAAVKFKDSIRFTFAYFASLKKFSDDKPGRPPKSTQRKCIVMGAVYGTFGAFFAALVAGIPILVVFFFSSALMLLAIGLLIFSFTLLFLFHVSVIIGFFTAFVYTIIATVTTMLAMVFGIIVGILDGGSLGVVLVMYMMGYLIDMVPIIGRIPGLSIGSALQSWSMTFFVLLIRVHVFIIQWVMVTVTTSQAFGELQVGIGLIMESSHSALITFVLRVFTLNAKGREIHPLVKELRTRQELAMVAQAEMKLHRLKRAMLSRMRTYFDMYTNDTTQVRDCQHTYTTQGEGKTVCGFTPEMHEPAPRVDDQGNPLLNDLFRDPLFAADPHGFVPIRCADCLLGKMGHDNYTAQGPAWVHDWDPDMGLFTQLQDKYRKEKEDEKNVLAKMISKQAKIVRKLKYEMDVIGDRLVGTTGKKAERKFTRFVKRVLAVIRYVGYFSAAGFTWTLQSLPLYVIDGLAKVSYSRTLQVLNTTASSELRNVFQLRGAFLVLSEIKLNVQEDTRYSRTIDELGIVPEYVFEDPENTNIDSGDAYRLPYDNLVALFGEHMIDSETEDHDIEGLDSIGALYARVRAHATGPSVATLESGRRTMSTKYVAGRRRLFEHAGARADHIDLDYHMHEVGNRRLVSGKTKAHSEGSRENIQLRYWDMEMRIQQEAHERAECGCPDEHTHLSYDIIHDRHRKRSRGVRGLVHNILHIY